MADRFPFSRLRPGSAHGPERSLDVFVRGLLSGAVVGAVVAGSALWERRHRQRKGAEAATSAVEAGTPGPAEIPEEPAAG